MMRFLASVLLVVLTTGPAVAGLDPATDSIGIYFDPDGNTNCTTAAPFEPFPAYLVLMNPAGPTNGFECSVAVTGVPHFFLSTVLYDCMIDADYPPGEFWCGVVNSYPVRPSGDVIRTLVVCAPAGAAVSIAASIGITRAASTDGRIRACITPGRCSVRRGSSWRTRRAGGRR